MSEESDGGGTLGDLLGGVIAVAFFLHIVTAMIMALPGGGSEPTPFVQAVTEIAPFVWGFVLLTVGTFVLYEFVKATTNYVHSGGLKRDVRGWLGRE